MSKNLLVFGLAFHQKKVKKSFLAPLETKPDKPVEDVLLGNKEFNR